MSRKRLLSEQEFDDPSKSEHWRLQWMNPSIDTEAWIDSLLDAYAQFGTVAHGMTQTGDNLDLIHVLFFNPLQRKELHRLIGYAPGVVMIAVPEDEAHSSIEEIFNFPDSYEAGVLPL